MTIITRLAALERRATLAGGPERTPTPSPPSPEWRAAFEQRFTELWAGWTASWTEEEAQAEQERWIIAWRTGNCR